MDELLAKLAHGSKFSKIDLKQSYLQLEIIPEDSDTLTLSTCKGLYKINRLMYGIAPGLTIWQREIENILRSIEGVEIFIDDIIITGESDTVHLSRLEEVLKKLHNYNIRLNLEKSNFFMDKVNYCGYILDKEGFMKKVHKEKHKMETVENMPCPRNASEVRAFTGMINYYGRFIQKSKYHFAPVK